jgi:DNA-binding XRE family transcriptional regulator
LSAKVTPEDEFEAWLICRQVVRSLVETRIRKRVSQEQMAQALHVSLKRVRELEDRSDWHVATLGRYAYALGLEVTVSMVPNDQEEAHELAGV